MHRKKKRQIGQAARPFSNNEVPNTQRMAEGERERERMYHIPTRCNRCLLLVTVDYSTPRKRKLPLLVIEPLSKTVSHTYGAHLS